MYLKAMLAVEIYGEVKHEKKAQYSNGMPVSFVQMQQYHHPRYQSHLLVLDIPVSCRNLLLEFSGILVP